MRIASRLLALACLLPLAAFAQAGKTVKIGVLNDQSGLYTDLGGPGSVIAAKMAAEEFGNKVAGMPIEIVTADHQNKPDIASSIATKWIDVDGVDAILDVPNSGCALAVNKVVADKNKVFIDSGAATSNLTGKDCKPNTVHWT
ncbi:MAG TPA: ABC transporter substrate-binding protein, partial [Myxococcaceae bacterium]